MPRFCANLNFLFTEVPLLDRFEAAAKAGFKAVEIGNPYEASAATSRPGSKANGLTLVADQHHRRRRGERRARAIGAGRPREGLRRRPGDGARATAPPPAAS